MDFVVGDRVCAIRDVSQAIKPGCLGTVVVVENDTYLIGIEWDKNFGGHSLDARCAMGHGWWTNPDDLKVIFEYEENDYDMIAVSDEELTSLLCLGG